MSRLHLFELEDQTWFPRTIRDFGTDFLRFMGERSGISGAIARRLKPVLERTDSVEILDLCSGAGGPVVAVAEQLRREGYPVQVTLSDLYPNVPAFERAHVHSGGSVTFASGAIDASAVPPDLAGLRTMFNALHHFRPETARAILGDAVRQRRPIAIFEVPQRTPFGVFIALVVNPIFVLLTTPFIRPFRWTRVLFTYPLPIVTLLVWWDGLVSGLRAYSPEELRQLAAGLDDSGYTWEAGRDPFPRPITYLVGYPVSPPIA